MYCYLLEKTAGLKSFSKLVITVYTCRILLLLILIVVLFVSTHVNPKIVQMSREQFSKCEMFIFRAALMTC